MSQERLNQVVQLAEVEVIYFYRVQKTDWRVLVAHTPHFGWTF